VIVIITSSLIEILQYSSIHLVLYWSALQTELRVYRHVKV